MEETNSTIHSDNTLTEQPEIKEEYPRMVERYKAMVVDGLFILLGFVLAGMAFSVFENAPGYVRGAVFFFIIFLYEPILVSLFSGTIGHHVMRIMVKSYANRDRNVFFPMSLLRSAVKWPLGWISFITLLSDEEKRAIHDMAGNSIVLYRKR